MEAINVLESKPKGIKLFDSVVGECVIFDRVEDNHIICSYNGNTQSYKGNGKIFDNKDAIVVLNPSKSMRDWSKFAWKKGDVLTNGKAFVIFDNWCNNIYTPFNGLYYLGKIYTHDVCCKTEEFYKATQEDRIVYIEKIEKYYGGKLNLSTLEIEKPQFKDGDIVFVEGTENYCDYIEIFSHFEDGDICDHASYDIEKSKLDCDGYYNIGKDEYQNIRPATDSEKQQLFDALANVNKAWDAEKKRIVDLPKKCEFKPKDWCLMRGGNEHINSDWTLCQFSHLMKCGMYRAIGGCAYNECIPYNDKTAHLLGTTDDWKGGKE